jgi:hypothetical protein
MATHFVECAYENVLHNAFHVPILEEGLFIRDFTRMVRETLSISEDTDVVLLDPATGQPFRGKHWLLPCMAVAIRLQKKDVEASFRHRAALSVLHDTPSSSPPKHGVVTVYVDAMYVATGFAAMAIAPFVDNDILVCLLPDVTSCKQCDRAAIRHAITYARATSNSFVQVLSSSLHARDMPTVDGASVTFLPLSTTEFTRLRKHAVKYLHRL